MITVADRLNGDGVMREGLRPGSREFLDILDEMAAHSPEVS